MARMGAAETESLDSSTIQNFPTIEMFLIDYLVFFCKESILGLGKRKRIHKMDRGKSLGCFLFGGFLGLLGGAFLGSTQVERENIVIKFNGSAKFAVENGYADKKDLAQIGYESIKKESANIVTAHLR